MILKLLLTGIAAGFMVAMPVGPIGLLIIQRTVNKSRLSGIISGLGAALADTFFAVIAGYSLTFITDLLKQYQYIFQLVGGLAILGVGLHIYFKNPVHDLRKYRRKGNTPVKDLSSTFILTLTNPFTIFALLALFAGTGIVTAMDRPYQNIFLVTGVFFGASFWWLSLTEVVTIFKHRFNLRLLWWFNKIAGTLIVLFVFISVFYTVISGFRT
jgi:threonine/homoserine/homoserine lactone efflux protein